MKLTTRFCQTCNARDRIIQHGRCITCGYRPETKYGAPHRHTWEREIVPADPAWGHGPMVRLVCSCGAAATSPERVS